MTPPFDPSPKLLMEAVDQCVEYWTNINNKNKWKEVQSQQCHSTVNFKENKTPNEELRYQFFGVKVLVGETNKWP